VLTSGGFDNHQVVSAVNTPQACAGWRALSWVYQQVFWQVSLIGGAVPWVYQQVLLPTGAAFS
jgi:hypothetical protein